METKHLSYFKVENFKRFDSLEVNDIGQFNLIVGDNNVGKTSLLEALLFDDENYDSFLKNIHHALLANRRIVIQEDKSNYLDFYLKNKKQPISFRYKCLNEVHNLLVSKSILSDLSEDQVSGMGGLWAAKSSNTPHLIRLESDNDVQFIFASYQFVLVKEDWDSAHNESYPFIGFNSDYENDILVFSSLSINSAKLEKLESEMRFFIPALTSIEINNAIVINTPTIAIREKNTDLKPLSQYGDGSVKLFRLLLKLELIENNRLMIDEIDAGIHYSRMKEFLYRVIQSAKNKNVQLFATTHSKECIKYYAEALKELGFENEGRIIKLADTKSGIKAYTSNYAEFTNSLLAESEIR